MQSEMKHIYKMTADRTGEDEQTYKDIGNTVFAHLNGLLRRPPSLIMKLKGVGSWYLRKKRMEIITTHYPPQEKNPESAHGIMKQENKIELYNLFTERLKDYELYLAIRNEIREKRRETQILLEPVDKED